MDRKMTAKERENFFYMSEAMRRLEWDLHHTIEVTNRIPEAWHEIARRPHPQPTERVTVRLDRDVLKFFRSMGAGYGPRLNEVLRSYMHARLAGVIGGADTAEMFRQAKDHEGERPVWGETGAAFGMGGPTLDDQTRDRQARMREMMRKFGLEGERE
ncbi:BrnA antitoxin family protein [Thioclava sp. FR2]|uniref:BrnA antitoxin family protein n=1 Tax=Thioclava sp. FR2 TaxID=3445780 RepID=UPI003EBE324D